MIAALYVEPDGCYAGLDGVDAWAKARDAREYSGSWPVVAHPDCKRWGRMAKGGPAAPNTEKIGDDKGCFAHALWAVRTFGGVIEHPADSLAWDWFGIMLPPDAGGWVWADKYGGWTCHVEQGHYGHFARKPTWLYAAKVDLPSLIWGKSPQRIHPVALERYGYEKARRIGQMAMVGGKDKTKIRNSTPIEFRDLLIAMAKTARKEQEAA